MPVTCPANTENEVFLTAFPMLTFSTLSTRMPGSRILRSTSP